MGVGRVAGIGCREVTFRKSSGQCWSQRIPSLLSIDLCHFLPMMLGKLLPVVVWKQTWPQNSLTLTPMRGGDGGGWGKWKRSFLTLGGFVTTQSIWMVALILCDSRGWVRKGHAASAYLSLGEASHYVGNAVAPRLASWRGVLGHGPAELPADQQHGLPAMNVSPVDHPAYRSLRMLASSPHLTAVAK